MPRSWDQSSFAHDISCATSASLHVTLTDPCRSERHIWWSYENALTQPPSFRQDHWDCVEHKKKAANKEAQVSKDLELIILLFLAKGSYVSIARRGEFQHVLCACFRVDSSGSVSPLRPGASMAQCRHCIPSSFIQPVVKVSSVSLQCTRTKHWTKHRVIPKHATKQRIRSSSRAL